MGQPAQKAKGASRFWRGGILVKPQAGWFDLHMVHLEGQEVHFKKLLESLLCCVETVLYALLQTEKHRPSERAHPLASALRHWTCSRKCAMCVHCVCVCVLCVWCVCV